MESVNFDTRLEMYLDKIKRSGEFCCGGAFPGHLPGIFVKDCGMLGLPLAKDKAEALTRACSLLRFGHEEEAIQDKQACSSWQLDPSQFSICNPEWHSMVEQLVCSKIKSELSLPSSGAITVQLHSLFLYNKGECCLPHCDAEKDNPTLAMLLLLLPSIYSGGKLIIAHKEDEETFDYSLDSVFKNHYVAFYTNCRHLFQPVENGNLLALIYNLVPASPICSSPLDVDKTAIIRNVNEILYQWQVCSKEGAWNQKPLVIVLNHTCSKRRLSWENLKGSDRAISYVVKSASDKLPINIYLCLIYCTQYFGCNAIEFHEVNEMKKLCDRSEDSKNRDASSSVSGDSKMSSNNSYDDDAEVDPDWHFSHFIKVTGEGYNLNNIHPSMCDIIPFNAFKGKFPYKEDVMATGRMGATKLKCYRQAALLLLPRKNFSQIITEGSLNETIDLALECAEYLSKKKSDESQQKSNTAVMAVISRIEALMQGDSSTSFIVPDSQDYIKILKALQLIQNRVLFHWFISTVIMPQLNSLSVEVLYHLATATAEFGLDVLLPVFQSLIISGQTPTVMNLLKEMCVSHLGSINFSEKLTHLLASNVLERLLGVEDKNLQESRKFRSLQDLYRDTIIAVTDLFCTYSTFGNEDWLQQAINYVRRTPLRHPLEIVVTSAINNWHNWLMDQTRESLCNATIYQFAFKQQIRLVEDCIQQLMLVKEPKELTNSSRSTVKTCKCSDCKNVEDFMNNVGQNILSMLVSQTTLEHLKKCRNIEAFDVGVKQMGLKTFLDDALLTLTLTKRNVCDRLRETYHQCQVAIITLASLLPQNHHLKLQPQVNFVEVPPKKAKKN